MELFCLLLPAVISAWIYKKTLQKESMLDVVLHYGMFAIVVNVICMMACILVSGSEYVLSLSSTPTVFVLKYLFMACFISGIVGIIYCLCSRMLDIKFVIVKEKRKEKHHEK